MVVGVVAMWAPAHAQESTLTVTSGSWGYGPARKIVKDDLAKLCDGKSLCRFMAANETFSGAEPKDPSPGNDKGLIVQWRCGERTYRDQFPEGKFAELACK
jgi:hypothetical protein